MITPFQDNLDSLENSLGDDYFRLYDEVVEGFDYFEIEVIDTQYHYSTETIEVIKSHIEKYFFDVEFIRSDSDDESYIFQFKR